VIVANHIGGLDVGMEVDGLAKTVSGENHFERFVDSSGVILV